MRFQDAAKDARTVVYAGIQADPAVSEAATLLADASTAQRVLARAVMNGQTTEPGTWRVMFPTLFPAEVSDAADAGDPVSAADQARSEAILACSLRIADRGDEIRNQLRGALVEALTERLLVRRIGSDPVRRERRILFDGVRAEIHPYDVTVERDGAAEAYDCKWGARGINADVLNQLDDARTHAVDEDERLAVALVIFDATLSCEVRLARQTAPTEGIGLFGIESLDRLADRPR